MRNYRAEEFFCWPYKLNGDKQSNPEGGNLSKFLKFNLYPHIFLPQKDESDLNFWSRELCLYCDKKIIFKKKIQFFISKKAVHCFNFIQLTEFNLVN